MLSIKLFLFCTLSFKLVLGGGDGAAGQIPQLSQALTAIAGKYSEVSKNISEYDPLIQNHINQNLRILAEEIPKSDKTLVLQKLFDVLQQNNLYVPPTTPEAPEGRSDDHCSRIASALTNLNATRSNFQLRKASNSRFLESLQPVLDELKTVNFESENLTNCLKSANGIFELLQTVQEGFIAVESGTANIDDVWNELASICPNVNSTVAGRNAFTDLGSFVASVSSFLAGAAKAGVQAGIVVTNADIVKRNVLSLIPVIGPILFGPPLVNPLIPPILLG